MLAHDGLIKIKSHCLLTSGDFNSRVTQFCRYIVHGILHRANTSKVVDSICAGRTLLKDNAYLQEVLPAANSDRATKFATLALTASYYKEFLDDQNPEKERMRKLEARALRETFTLLASNDVSFGAARMLFVQHAVLNRNLHRFHWTDYLCQSQDSPDQQANLIMAGHAVWLMAIIPLTDRYRFQTFNYDWIGRGEENRLTKVNSILGTSRKMLHF